MPQPSPMSIDWAAIWTVSPWQMIAWRMPAAPTPLANSESKAACRGTGPTSRSSSIRSWPPDSPDRRACSRSHIGVDCPAASIPGSVTQAYQMSFAVRSATATCSSAAPDLGDLPRLVMVDRKVGDPIAQLAMDPTRQARPAGRRRSSGPPGRQRGSPRNMPSKSREVLVLARRCA